MGKASKIVTLALIGAGVGTLAYNAAPSDDEDDYADDFGSSTQPATRGTGGYGSRSYARHSSGGWWFWGGSSGSSYRSGTGNGGSYHSSNSGTSRGGFGGIGHSSSGSHS
jgi:hypothetical protein